MQRRSWMLRLVPRCIKDALKRRVAASLQAERAACESYGQFGEDICIRNLLAAAGRRAVGPLNTATGQPAGFYVDVGAYHPELNSNTYWFYKHGWHGLNVDVRAETKILFDDERPRDTTVQAVVSDVEQAMTLYSWSGRPEMTTLSETRAEQVAKQLGPPRSVTVQTRTLAKILAEHLAPGQAIDFLTVDAEGHDLEVLRSNDWTRYRPELVVAEEHGPRIEAVLESGVTHFMQSVGYRIAAWIPPSVIYVKHHTRDV